MQALARLILCATAVSTGWAQPPRSEWRFQFGTAKPQLGWIAVAPSARFTPESGYGYEGALPADGRAVYFSAAVPEGNYRVTVKFGDPHTATATTIKAELRRLMLEDVRTAAGESVTRTFLVNVRTPKIAGGGEVRLKPREKDSETWAWDERLTLEFNGSHPGVETLAIEPAGQVPVLYIAGDSTSTDQAREPYSSWGQMLPRFFKPAIVVANHGESGESSRSFLGERRLDKIAGLLKAGDYLFIQFGHNDQKERGEGVGAFTTYAANLRRFVAAARERGATPVLITPVQRHTFDGEGLIANSLGDYPEAVRTVARAERVPLIDLHTLSKTLYEALGPQTAVEAFAPNDGTHHNNYGSYQLARAIVESIRHAALPLEPLLAGDAKPFDPARPGPPSAFHLAPSPLATAVKPYGN